MGFTITAEQYADLQRKGLIPPELSTVTPAKPKPKRSELLPSAFRPPATWLIGLVTVSEANSTDGKRSMMGRIASQRRAISRAIGPHLRHLVPFVEAFHNGQRLTITLTRLAPRPLDQWDNLPRSLKAVLDSVCLIAGIDDGSELLTVEYRQEASQLMGVKIELTTGVAS